MSTLHANGFSMQHRARLIAFYLPQYHPIPENDAWWGKGFTEWTNVTRSRPLFPGHNQPRQPADLGYYDLRVPETRDAQAELAREHGIYGFCYHYYWFSNEKRLLERPLEEVLASGKPDFPFCICWANENWTRRWDGQDAQILMRQNYSPENDIAFLRSVFPYFRDSRYIRVDGKPLLVIYRTSAFPDLEATVQRWRDELSRCGEPDLYLVAAEAPDTFGERAIRAGFDAVCEFPPHHTGNTCDADIAAVNFSTQFSGSLFDYEKVVNRFLSRPRVGYRRLRGVTLEWDNTARRRSAAHAMVNYSLGAYYRWLRGAVDEAARNERPDERIVFINAWNEWAEGAYLEPDSMRGLAPLRATLAALEARPMPTQEPADTPAAGASNGFPPAHHAEEEPPAPGAITLTPANDAPLSAKRRLRIVSITMMGCEADIAEGFVRANVCFVDHMFIVLNNAHDGTADILDALHREGLPITISKTPSGRFTQRETINRLAREIVSNEEIDWLIPLDADEFIDAPGRDALEAALVAHGPRHALVAWRNHVATPFDANDEPDPLRRLRHCYEYPPPDPATNPWVWKAFVNVPLFAPYTDRYEISRGGHRVELAGLDEKSSQPDAPLVSVRLRHFPVRSHDQLLLKGSLGWIQLRLTEGASPGHTLQWELFDKISRNETRPSVATLQEATRQYLNYGRASDDDLADTPVKLAPFPAHAPTRYGALRLSPAAALLNWLNASLFPQGTTPATPHQTPSNTRVPGSRRRPQHIAHLWKSFANAENSFLDATYHDKVRTELIQLIGNPGMRMLDVGCAAGATSAVLKANYPKSHFTGLELNHKAAQIAAQRLDVVIRENIETLPLPDARLPDANFDTILLADVLEHLANPWDVLARLRRLLKPAGKVVACIPNVFNLRLLDDLAQGDWHYAANGLLDITHLRFFTAESMQRMFEETGYKVVSITGLRQSPAELPEYRREALRSVTTANLTLHNLSPEKMDALTNLQYVLICTPNAS
jgi:2-polyprenyl-3-methyl-5-hydroxy-6-metoxy-1,4-benzoquinol methylase